MSDNSYRLFVSPPDANQDQLLRDAASGKSTSAPASRANTNNGSKSTSADKSSSSTSGDAGQIKGPIRLLRLLPRDTRVIIGRMLEIDPRKRANMDEVLANEWVQNALVCTQEEGGRVHHAPNHRHHLEGSGASNVTSKK